MDIDTQLLINIEDNTVKTRKKTINSWEKNTWYNFNYLVKAGSLLTVIIGIMNTLNVFINRTSLNEEWDWEEIFQQTINSEIIEATAFSLNISEIKNILTNFAKSQLKKYQM